ncbi:hypothetical protein KSF_088130 [Reticulibacter mediterranei]|uniref:Uncharacterized protein n=1 Tax=Reticulibacter mediterranei TaxID=2778369 RepID=A0A8J3IUJ3_9CHLR|nr:hypothetical protein KSF_088130 [Reticulibacter mediterranei]
MAKLACYLQAQARFAHPWSAGEREQAHLWAREERLGSLHGLLAANQWSERPGEGRRDELDSVTWRWLWKNDKVVLHILSPLQPQAMVSTA